VETRECAHVSFCDPIFLGHYSFATDEHRTFLLVQDKNRENTLVKKKLKNGSPGKK
jgi:hypothetical protein